MAPAVVSPPNILLVMTDQMTPFMLDACSGIGARMTNLQALADRGSRFTTAYTASPICAPARASFMTGLNVAHTGCYDNGDPFPSFVPTFAHYLTNAGYEVVLSGKMHFIGADQLHGFKRRLTTDVYPSDFQWSYPLIDEDDPNFKAFDFAPQFQCQNIGPGWSTELQYDEETHFKRSLYEWSTRIPLIVAVPGAAPQTVDTPVSLMDVTATVLDVVGAQAVRPLDGRSLLPAIHGESLPDVPVVAEYHGEAIMRPSFMVRRGPWKYIYMHGAAGQLFNLERDPDEWHNLAGRPETAVIEKELNRLITGGTFDLEFIARDVWERLAQKQVVQAAMDRNGTSWDYRVEIDPATQYVRR